MGCQVPISTIFTNANVHKSKLIPPDQEAQATNYGLLRSPIFDLKDRRQLNCRPFTQPKKEHAHPYLVGMFLFYYTTLQPWSWLLPSLSYFTSGLGSINSRTTATKSCHEEINDLSVRTVAPKVSNSAGVIPSSS
jgi:hypothetical protein